MGKAPETIGRLCEWYDDEGEVVMLTCDQWSPDGELVTIEVIHVGPFDSWRAMKLELLERMRSRQLELW